MQRRCCDDRLSRQVSALRSDSGAQERRRRVIGNRTGLAERFSLVLLGRTRLSCGKLVYISTRESDWRRIIECGACVIALEVTEKI